VRYKYFEVFFLRTGANLILVIFISSCILTESLLGQGHAPRRCTWTTTRRCTAAEHVEAVVEADVLILPAAHEPDVDGAAVEAVELAGGGALPGEGIGPLALEVDGVHEHQGGEAMSLFVALDTHSLIFFLDFFGCI
jgi:hypothetical protein